ncbi:MAG: hypothetical protein QOJ98_2711 [Acidobacteriota bacterium]|jgi:hypothetical protein|nr:hypothetical protein [Acidobacteriota bacterium]
MNVNTRRVGVAALALVICLSISPVAAAVQPNDAFVGIRERITRILKKLKNFGGIATFEDTIGPPRPTPTPAP